MTKPALLMTGPLMSLIEDGLARQFTIHRLFMAGNKDAFLKEVGPTIEAIAGGGVDDALMAKLPKLKIIANFGVGYDSVDAAAAARRGIIVTNTPDVLTEEVADTTLGLLLMTVRELGQSEQWLRAGEWVADGPYRLTPHSLRDRHVGMIGFGRIGKAIARRIEAFGLPISYFGRRKQDGIAYPFYSDLVAMAKAVDTLVIITPGGAETKNLVNADVLKALGPRGIVINVARGSVVDEPALIAAIRNKTIWGAGLDVMWNEPDINPDLLTLDNTVLLPHVGSASIHTRNGMGQLVVDNCLAYAARKPPLTPVPETPFKNW